MLQNLGIYYQSGTLNCLVLPVPKVRLNAKKITKKVVVILTNNRYVSVNEITYDILSVFYSSSVSIL